MGVRDGLVTPKSGEVAICATQEKTFFFSTKNGWFNGGEWGSLRPNHFEINIE